MHRFSDWFAAHKIPPSVLSILGLAVGVLLLLYGARGLFAQNNTPPEIGEDIPIRAGENTDFALPDWRGRTVHLSDYRGRPVIINLWAAWCPPCRAEMPDLVRFYQEHQREGLVLLAVDSADTREKAEAFMQGQPMPFTVLWDPKGEVMNLFNTLGLPSTFVIDRNGKVRFAWNGQITPNILSQRILPLIQE